MTPEILQERIEVYLARLGVRGPQVPAVFEAMHVEANRRTFPIVGPEVGRFFFQLAALRRPARVLELGSGFGYSALWWALGCPSAEIHLTEWKQSNLEEARRFAREAGVEGQLHFHAGDALGVARTLAGPWDIIFCDINKEEYPAALDFAAGVLRPGDLLVFDNMLWHGRVARDEGDWDKETEAAVLTTRRLYDDAAWHCSLHPIRDGVLVALRAGNKGAN
jgi:caffeoyl-CoA O-methyltransferase